MPKKETGDFAASPVKRKVRGNGGAAGVFRDSVFDLKTEN